MADSIVLNVASRTGSLDRAPEENAPALSATSLTLHEELLLQQLKQAQFWSERNGGPAKDSMPIVSSGQEAPDTIPELWRLTRGLVLHDWQEGCIDAWFKNGKRGVIKVVTGAGKTILALAIAERLQQTER